MYTRYAVIDTMVELVKHSIMNNIVPPMGIQHVIIVTMVEL